MPSVIGVEIVESYKNWQSPVNAPQAVVAAVSSVPHEYLKGLQSIVLTNASGLNRTERRKKVKHRGRTRKSMEALGSYRQAWYGQPASIELFVDNIVAQCPRAIKLPPIRDVFFANTLFHEIGHHIHLTQKKLFRDRECVADDWARRLGEIYLRKRRWYLFPLLKCAGLYTSLRITEPSHS
jgi:predicted Zn-dependent protease with MMP-like domain